MIKLHVIIAIGDGKGIQSCQLFGGNGCSYAILLQKKGQFCQIVGAPKFNLGRKQDRFEQFFNGLLGVKANHREVYFCIRF